MKCKSRSLAAGAVLAATLTGGLALPVSADVVTDWNDKANEIVVESRLGTPPAVRVMAIVQTAVRDAVIEADGHAGTGPQARTASAPSVDAAVAAANRAALLHLLPTQQAAIQAAYQNALAGIAGGAGRDAGIAIGERAAAAVLAVRGNDGAGAPESYRPHTTAGAYVPTALPAAWSWQQRTPWLMSGPSQFRPGPPPSLDSATWARDYNEVKVLGARTSTQRSAEQTAIARFWEYSLPPIYYGLVRSVARADGRSVARNAHLYAAIAQAMDDALIAVFDAKYHYNFWRPITAIRNGDADGHDGTVSDATWAPFIDTPLHPEYPCAHCILAAAVATVLEADAGPGIPLETASPSAKGAVRRWAHPGELVREVADARVYDGVHYRNSTAVGVAMGRRVGELAVASSLACAPDAGGAGPLASSGTPEATRGLTLPPGAPAAPRSADGRTRCDSTWKNAAATGSRRPW